MKHLVLSLFATLSLFLGACKSTEPAGAQDMAGDATVNTVCPMMPSHEVDPAVTRDYMGYSVGFCCAGCIDKWDALSDDGKKMALEAAGFTMK